MDQLSPEDIGSKPEAVEAEAFLSRLRVLQAQYEDLDAEAILETAVNETFAGSLAMVSAFGSESAVELHILSRIAPWVPVLFLNTGKMFPETLRYRDLLQERFGLTDVRAIGPDPRDREKLDPQGILWSRNPDMCCHFRKVAPLERGLEGFEAAITGRKRFQTRARAKMKKIELIRRPEGFEGFRFMLNPLAAWSAEQLEGYIVEHKLPRHPLVKDGYLSIGCMPCTDRVAEGGDYRQGRWSGSEKEECGIHQSSFVGGEGI